MFDERVDNRQLYEQAVQPLVGTIFRGGKGTCFAYGQTGSGKTYTMSPLPLRAADDIFAIVAQPAFAGLALHVRWGRRRICVGALRRWRSLGEHVLVSKRLFSINTSDFASTPVCCLHCHRSCYEIYGGKVFDLLNGRKKLDVREDGRRRVQVVGLRDVEVASAGVLQQLCDHAAAARSTGSTGANDESSRCGGAGVGWFVQGVGCVFAVFCFTLSSGIQFGRNCPDIPPCIIPPAPRLTPLATAPTPSSSLGCAPRASPARPWDASPSSTWRAASGGQVCVGGWAGGVAWVGWVCGGEADWHACR